LNKKEQWAKVPIQVGNNISFVFSWQLWKWLQNPTEGVVIGGPAVVLNREWIPDNVIVGEHFENALSLHNSMATRTTRGCPRRCKFCGVKDIHPKFEELRDWEVKPIVIDDNLLYASKAHFDCVIDSLKLLKWCDFQQGLDPRLLTKYHADRFAELRNPMIRLSMDSSKYIDQCLQAYTLLRQAGLPKSRIRVYVLIGFDDTPEDALYRLKIVWKDLGVFPNPMRYTPLNTKKKNEYIAKDWTHEELVRYMRYWARLRYTAKIPFEEFVYGYKSKKK
jgi:hypothetical protein